MDDWKNSNNNTENVVCMLDSCGKENMFLDSVNITGESEICNKLSKIVDRCVEKAKNMYKTNMCMRW